MRIAIIAATIAVTTMLAVDLAAQRRGGGRANRWRQPEEITNRVGMFFRDVEGPKTDGDKVADLGSLELVRAATSANQLSVLYLVDDGDDERTRQMFEWQLGQNREIGIQLRCFHCGRIDLEKNAALAERYGKKAPLFVVFDADGKATEVSMAGYKPSATSLKRALEKAASGTIKPSLSTFAKRYADIVEDLGKLLAKKQQEEARLAKAGKDDAKRKKLEKELKKLEAEQQKLLEKEQDFLGKLRLPERPAGARRLGERPRRDRGEDGGEDRGRGRRGGGN